MENTSGIHPINDYVLIMRDPQREKSAGGIILPQDVQADEERTFVNGILVAVGGNAFEKTKPPVPQVGDKVRVHPAMGTFIYGQETLRTEADKKAGVKYLLCFDRDIQGIVTE